MNNVFFLFSEQFEIFRCLIFKHNLIMKKMKKYCLILFSALVCFNTSISAENNTNEKKKVPFGCTSLRIKDKQGNVYHGRTMEYSQDLPFNLTYYPVGNSFSYNAPDNKTKGLSYKNKYEMLVITFPESEIVHAPVEGVNSAGLSGSLNMKPGSNLPVLTQSQYSTSLNWALLIEWALSNCGSVQEIKSKINDISLWTEGLPVYSLSNFHFIFYDNTGDCIVVEASDDKLHVIDNPTGVLTNAPDFNWHLTNLNNYTQLTNIDANVSTKLGNLKLQQPDTGIAVSALPSSDTSVGRFVRAVFYTSYALLGETPESAMIQLSHIMNKFDRPKNMTVSTVGEEGEPTKPQSEYSEWTALTNLLNREMYIRSYYDFNYKIYSIKDFSKEKKKVVIPIVK